MKKITTHFLAIVGFLFIGLSSYGQALETNDSSLPSDSANEDLYAISLEDLLNMDMELETGSFLDMDLKNAPVSMTIISSDQVTYSGARHLSELLEIYVPGFQYMFNKWNGAIWGMRGVAASRNTAFIFLVNGHKMNHESRDGAMSELDLGLLGDIERVEVLRGPAGLVYGSGAISGVVNIVTKDIHKDNNFVKVGVNAWDKENMGAQGEIMYNHEVNEDFAFNIDAGYRYSNGVGMNNSRIYGKASWPYPFWRSDIPQDGVPTTGAAWSTPGNFKAGATIKYKNLKVYTRATRQITNASGFFPLDAWPDYAGAVNNDTTGIQNRNVDGISRAPQSFYGEIEGWHTDRRQYLIDNYMAEATYKMDVGANDLELVGGFDAVTNRIQRQPIEGIVSVPTSDQEFIEETFGERRYNLEAIYGINTVDKLQLALGYQFRFMDIGNDMSGKNEKAEDENLIVVSDVNYTNHAFFAEGLYDINDMFAVNFGARYDVHTRTKQHGGIVSPKLALITKLNEKNVIKLIFQSSANNGSADTYEWNRNHYNSQGELKEYYSFENPEQVPNENTPVLPAAPTQEELDALEPERATSFEIASVHEIGDRFVLQPSLSYTNIKNLFVWEQAIFRMFNGGEYNVLNFDIEAKYITEKVNLGINHTIQKPVNTDMDQTISYEEPVWGDHSQAELVNGEYIPVPKKDADGNDMYTTTVITPIQNSVTIDGAHFANLATNTTKLFADYSPTQHITLHTSVRTFWGLRGQSVVYEENPQFNNLDSDRMPIIKWNIGIHLKPSENWIVSLMAYDILAENGRRHALRWQQMGEPAQTDLYSADLRSYALNVAYKF